MCVTAEEVKNLLAKVASSGGGKVDVDQASMLLLIEIGAEVTFMDRLMFGGGRYLTEVKLPGLVFAHISKEVINWKIEEKKKKDKERMSIAYSLLS